jgi:hypothetical protein
VLTCTDEAIAEAFRVSGGWCQCHLGERCGHARGCANRVKWQERGLTWQVVYVDLVADDAPANPGNCLILCHSCYRTWTQLQAPSDRRGNVLAG